MIESIIPDVILQVNQGFSRINPNLSRDLDQVAAMLRKEMESKRSEVLDVLARAYTNQFTETELNDLLQFYKTPLGQKLALKGQAAQQDRAQAVEEWSSNFGHTVIMRTRAAMEKRGHPIN